MPALIQIRRDIAANWTNVNPVPAQGEMCWEIDTNQLKIGDGTTPWATLEYFGGGNASEAITTSATAPLNGEQGDIYFNTTDGVMYVHNGIGWGPVAGDLNSHGDVNTAGALDGQVLTYDSATDTWMPGSSSITVSNLAPASAEIGDTYYNTSSKQQYIYDGATWTAVDDGIADSLRASATEPSLAQDGTPLADGDVYFNTAEGVTYVFNNGQWGPISEDSSSVVTYTTAPVIGMVAGDIYYNTTDKTLYAYDGAQWVAIGGEGASTTNIYAAPVAPSPAAAGDTFFNTTTNEMQVFDGSSWNNVDTDTVNTSGAFDAATGDYSLTDSQGGVITTNLDGRYTTPSDVATLITTNSAGSLDDLSDVDTTGSLASYVLRDSGTGWVASDPAAFSIYLAAADFPESDTGFIYFNTSTDELRVKDSGGNWQPVNTDTKRDVHYQGVLSANPANRWDGSAIQYGDLYFNSSTEKLMWNEGSSWLPVDTTVTNSSAAFDNATGNLTVTDSRSGTVTVNLDGRYATGTIPTSLNDLSDVNATPSNTDVLSWNGATSKWEAASLSAISNPLAFNDLTDVNTSGVTSGQVMKFNGVSWVPATPSNVSALNDLSNVLANPTADGDTVSWSAANSRWEAKPAVAAASETLTTLALNANTLSYIDESGVQTDLDLSLYLDDTNLARLVSGTFDNNTGIATFTRDDATTFTLDLSSMASGANELTDLTDVILPGGAAQGDVLTINGTGNYEFITPASVTLSLGQLSNVDSEVDDQPSERKFLTWSPLASKFVLDNASIDWLSDVDTSTTAPTDGQYLTWNATGSKWEPSSASGTVPDSQFFHTTLGSDGSGGWLERAPITLYMHYSTIDSGFETILDQAGVTTSPADTWPGLHYFNTSSDVIRIRDGNFDWNSIPSYPDTTAPTDGDALTWVATENQGRGGWIPQAVAAGATELNDLSDVLLGAPRQNGDSLIWDGTQFRNGFSTIFRTTDANLDNDYNILYKSSAPTSNINTDANDNITYNPVTLDLKVAGNVVLDTSDSINALSDVDTTTTAPTDGQSLVWNATDSKWVPGTVTGGGLPAATDYGQMLAYYGGSWQPVLGASSKGIEIDGFTGNILAPNYDVWATAEASNAGTIQLAMNESYKKITLTGATSLLFDTGTFGGGGTIRTLTIELTTTGSPTITWPSQVVWPEGTAPTINDGTHLITFVCDSSNATRVFGNYLTNFA